MPGPTELFVILAIALVIFGGKKLRNLGGDLGGAISEFKTSLNEKDDEAEETTSESPTVASANEKEVTE